KKTVPQKGKSLGLTMRRRICTYKRVKLVMSPNWGGRNPISEPFLKANLKANIVTGSVVMCSKSFGVCTLHWQHAMLLKIIKHARMMATQKPLYLASFCLVRTMFSSWVSFSTRVLYYLDKTTGKQDHQQWESF
ncbi:hypothetical protein M1146_03650, partial [Patescibacteria group bacterium]|nr:hypothetical protein [Patescibacteria group bacterium]